MATHNPISSWNSDVLASLTDLWEALDATLEQHEGGALLPLRSVEGWRAERDVCEAANALIMALRNLDDVRAEEDAEDMRVARAEGGPNVMSGPQLGIKTGRAL